MSTMSSTLSNILAATTEASTKATAYTGGSELGDWPEDGTYSLVLQGVEIGEATRPHWPSKNNTKEITQIPAVQIDFWYRVVGSDTNGPDSNMEGRGFGDRLLISNPAEAKGDPEQVKKTVNGINAELARAKTAIGRALNIEIDNSWGITPDILQQLQAAVANEDAVIMVRGQVRTASGTTRDGKPWSRRSLIVRENIAS